MNTTTSATAAAAAKMRKPKAGKVSHAKPEQTALPLPGPAAPEFGQMDPATIIVRAQVRTEFDEDSLRELAADIADRGILQPLTVRKTEDGYVLVAGERRLRAAMLAQLVSIPVLVTTMSENEHHAAQLAENIQREDLSTYETAKAIKALHDLGNSVTEIAEQVHKSKSWISKRLAAANPNLSWQARQLLEDGITEDLELVLTVDQVAKLDYYEGNQLAAQIKAGKAGRETARERLAVVKEKEGARQAQREQHDAEWNAPEAVAKREANRAEHEKQWKAQQDAVRHELHVSPKRQMANFWDWCAENPKGYGQDWLKTRDAEQLEMLTIQLDQWHAAGQGMTAEQQAKRLMFEYVKQANDYDEQAPRDYELAVMIWAGIERDYPMEVIRFLDWYKANLVQPVQDELKEPE